jgi:bla regulator protein blaR1
MPAYLTSALPSHLWQSTLFAAAAAMVTLALRKNHARTRYWIWLAASLKFLLPFSLLVELGDRLRWSTSASALMPPPAFSLTIEEISRPFLTPVTPGLIERVGGASATDALPLLLTSIWACGVIIVALAWCGRWRRVRAAVQIAKPLSWYAGVKVKSSSTLLEPGVFGIVRPVLILPEGIAERLAPAELKAILAHELCHIRRRDNLAAALHMAVEALFWFHPLVWWIGARLVEERERACDDEVLRLGSEPRVYAESILKTCQFYLESPVMCVSGITGADLKKRIIRIMTSDVTNKIGPVKVLLLAAAALITLAGPILVGLINTKEGRAQSPASTASTATPTASLPTFDVASVKPNKAGGMGMRIWVQPGGRFQADNVSLKSLIKMAYGVQDFQISGAPPWLDSDKYDIEAKANAPSEVEMNKMTDAQRDESFERNKLMVQALLADRFKLTLHKESKDAPIYVLVVAKNGPKLKEATAEEMAPPDPNDAPKPPGAKVRMPGRGIRMGRGDLTATAARVSFLAEVLSNQVGRTVVDKTGLTGNYDFSLKWTPDQNQGQMFGGPGGPGDGLPPPDPNGPSIFTALQEQLGLKLESQKGPVDLLVIDHAEKASEN